MNSSVFEKGTAFNLDNIPCQLVRVVPDSSDPDNTHKSIVQYETMGGLFEKKTMAELLQSYSEGRLTFVGTQAVIRDAMVLEMAFGQKKQELPAGLTDEMVKVINYRRGYLESILTAGRWRYSRVCLEPLIAAHAKETKDENPPSYKSVKRWYMRYQANRFAPISLMPLHHKKGGNPSTYRPGDTAIYNEFLEKNYLTRTRITLKLVHKRLVGYLKELNAKNPDKAVRIPTLSKLYSLMHAMPAFDRMVAREGRQRAILKYRRGRRGPVVTRVLERVETDHTKIKLLVKCDETGLVLGTPWLTVMFDAATREVIGFYVSFSGAGINSILSALTHAILPKTYVKEKYPEIQLDWPCYGVPNVLVLDNEPSHHSPEFKMACTNLGITLDYCPVRDPTQKGKVERFFRTFNETFIQQFPGAKTSNIQDPENRESEGLATISFNRLIEMLHVWFIDVYGNSVHRGLDTTPHAAWNQMAKNDPPRLPDSADVLNQKIRNVKEKPLHKYGIDINSLRYQSEELMALRCKIGENKVVEVRYDEDNIGSILVRIPGTNELFEVPSIYQKYPQGLSLVRHKALRKHLLATGQKASDEEALLNGLRRLQDIERESAVATKQATRRARAKQRGVSSRNVISPPVTTPLNTGKAKPKTGFFTGKATDLEFA